LAAFTLFDLVLAALRDGGREDCLDSVVPPGGGRSIPSSEVAREVECLSAGLVAFGVRPGDRVGVIAREGLDASLAELAVLGCGATSVPLDPALPATDLHRALVESAARVVLVSHEEQLGALLEVRPGLPELDLVLLFHEPAGEGAVPATLVETACRVGSERLEADPGLLDRARAGLSPQHPAYVVYPAAGITGRGVVLSHENLVEAAKALRAAIPLAPSDRVLSLLPVSCSGARPWHAAAMAGGAGLVFGRPGEDLSTRLREIRPTVLLAAGAAFDADLGGLVEAAVREGPPASWLSAWAGRVGRAAARDGLDADRLSVERSWKYRLAERWVLQRIRRRAGGALRLVVCINAPLSRERVLYFLGLGLPVLEGAGIPETTGVLCQNTPEAFRPGTVGRPLPGIRIEVDQEGIVWVRGAVVHLGWVDEIAEGAPPSGRVWIRSRIQGVEEAGGYLRITAAGPV
jgi:long-chain acyl-CoA synthetase